MTKKRKHSKPVRLPVRRDQGTQPLAEGQKLSEIIKHMAMRLMKNPDAIPSEPSAVAALMLAGTAWNSAWATTSCAISIASWSSRSTGTGRSRGLSCARTKPTSLSGPPGGARHGGGHPRPAGPLSRRAPTGQARTT